MRLYLHNRSAGYDPPTLRGAWDDAGGIATCHLDTAPPAFDDPAVVSRAEATATTPWSVALLRGVSAPLEAQTISGTFTLLVPCAESNANADFCWHVYVYVTQGDSDTPRGTLLADYLETTANEWPSNGTSPLARALASAQTLSSVAAQAGDRVVVELGYVSRNSVATSATGSIGYGAALPDDVVSRPWMTQAAFVEFSVTVAITPSPAEVGALLLETIEDPAPSPAEVGALLLEYLEPPGEEETLVAALLLEYLAPAAPSGSPALFPREGAYRGEDRLLAWVTFYGRDEAGADQIHQWSGHMLWDPASYEHGPKDGRVLQFGYYERPMSGARGDVRLANVQIQLSDIDRLLRGMLGRSKQYGLINRELVVKAILESQWRLMAEPAILFRGLLASYDMPADYLFSIEGKDWLGGKLSLPLPMVELTPALIPTLPTENRGRFAPYLYGRVSDAASSVVPPTIVAGPGTGAWFDGGVWPVAGFAHITECDAAPPSAVNVTAEAGGDMSLDEPNLGQYGVLLASIDSSGRFSDAVPFFYDVDQGGGRGNFNPTPVPWVQLSPGTQTVRVTWTDGASSVATRVWVGTYYFGARWGQFLTIPAGVQTCDFTLYPPFGTPIAPDNITPGASPANYLVRGAFQVAALVPDGETAVPPRLTAWVSHPYRRPMRVDWTHPTALEYVVYLTYTPAPSTLDWPFRTETDQPFFEFHPEAQEFGEADGLGAGAGRVPVIYIGPMMSPISGFPWEGFLVCYGAVKEIESAVQGEVPVDPGNFNTTWAVPGKGTMWAAEFGPALYRIFGGLRFTVIGVRGPDAADAIAGDRPIKLNVLGYDLVGDGSGEAIVSLYRAFEHLLEQQVLSDVPQCRIGGDWLPPPAWADGTPRVDHAALAEAEQQSLSTIGSPAGGFLITEPRTIGEWMRRFLLSLDCGFGWSREGQALVRLLPPMPPGSVSVDSVDHIRDIFGRSFRIRDDEVNLANVLLVNYQWDDTIGQFRRNATVRAGAEAEEAYGGRLDGHPLELFGRTSAVTARRIGARALQRLAKPERTITYQRGLAALDLDLGSRYRLEHPEGATAVGFLNRAAQINRVRFSVDEGTVEVSSWDLDWIGEAPIVEYLLEELMAEYELWGSRAHPVLLADVADQTVAPYDPPARAPMVQWSLLPETAALTCYIAGRVEAPGLSMRVFLYNVTDAVEIDDVVITSTADVETSFAVPAPPVRTNKEYRLGAQVLASGISASGLAVWFKGKLRTTFTP